jgi:DNA-binding PadR family transcriptional regulator
MREEHGHGMRDEEWGPSRPGRPEWGPRPGRGGGRRGGDWSERGNPAAARGGHGGRRFARGEGPFPPLGPSGPMGSMGSMGSMGQAGPMGPMFGRHPFGRGPRARKGDVRAAILDLLAEGGQWNGYQLIQEIAGRTSGVWRPSAGSVYPALQQLEDEELIAPEGEGRRRMYALTDKGRAYAEQHADELNGSWDAVAGMTDDDAVELGNMIRQVMMAVMEVRRAGSADQLAQARSVLAQARRAMYRILADDEPGETPAAPRADDTPPATGPDEDARGAGA